MLPGPLQYFASFGRKIVETFIIAAIFLLTSCGSSGGYLPANSTPRPLPSAPSISAITPASGPTSGGTSVTITASHLQSGATVTFGGVTATSVTYAHIPQPSLITSHGIVYSTGIGGTLASIGRITAVSPPGNVGTADVVVTNPDGESTTLPYGFTYSATPGSISSVRPGFGSQNGGTIVSIAGTGFESSAAILFGGTPGTDVSISKDGTLAQATAPAHAAGVVDVEVANPDGTSATASSAFTFGTAQIGCGTDCGNVGNPYGPPPDGTGVPVPANAVHLKACPGAGINPANGAYYIFDNDVGTDATAECFSATTVNSFTVDLGGHTVHGGIYTGTNGESGAITIMNGTVVCNLPSTNLGCVHGYLGPTPTGQYRVTHLTVAQQAPGAPLIDIYDNYATQNYSGGGSGLGRAVRIDHITATSTPGPSNRQTMIAVTGDGYVGAEMDNNSVTGLADTDAPQGLTCYGCSGFAAHNNQIVFRNNTTSQYGRMILWDAAVNWSVLPMTDGEVYANDLTVNNNVGVRFRGNPGTAFIAPSTASPAGAVRSKGVVTITGTSYLPVVFNVGDTVIVRGVADSSFNGTFTITSVSGKRFTYNQVGPDASSGCAPSVNCYALDQAVSGMRGVNIHDNILRNIRGLGTTNSGTYGAMEIGNNTAIKGLATGEIYHNALEINDGPAIMIDSLTGLKVDNNTVTCFQNDCSKAGYFFHIDNVVPSETGEAADAVIENNNVNVLTQAGKPVVEACGPAQSGVQYDCLSNPTTSYTTVTLCNSGKAVGNGKITNVDPPCP
jgi:IPT/TIG domain